MSNFTGFVRGVGGAATYKGDSWWTGGGIASYDSAPNTSDCSQYHALRSVISYKSTSNLWINDANADSVEVHSVEVHSVEDFTLPRTALYSPMHNVPWGSPYGLNVILGGGTASSLRPNPDDNPSALLDFEHMYMYDPATKRFRNQTAADTLPSLRVRFCSVRTPDFEGSYRIFISGE